MEHRLWIDCSGKGDASCEDDRILSQDTTQEMAEKVSPFSLLGQIQWKRIVLGGALAWSVTVVVLIVAVGVIGAL